MIDTSGIERLEELARQIKERGPLHACLYDPADLLQLIDHVRNLARERDELARRISEAPRGHIVYAESDGKGTLKMEMKTDCCASLLVVPGGDTALVHIKSEAIGNWEDVRTTLADFYGLGSLKKD